ncbi:MAG: M3 family metallopeptidase [Casimicrobiaceae bacterium]
MTDASNPLLAADDLPDFARVAPEHVAPAIEQLLAEARAAVARATAVEAPSWQNVVEPIAQANERLERVFGAVGHLNAVISSPALRDAYNAALEKVTAYFTELGLNRALYERYRALAEAGSGLTPLERRLLGLELRDFRLSGIDLQGADRERFQAINEALARASARFSDNVLDAVNAWALDVPVAELAGVPEDVVTAAVERASAGGLAEGMARLTLQGPCYTPVMQHAESRTLREQMYRGHATRASSEGDARFDNGPLMEEILRLRQEEARLLGYPDYATLSLVPKMAERPEQVLAFLRDLAARARPYAERDLAELEAFARSELGLDRLQAWDLSWASEKLRQARYALSEEALRQYFPEDAVLAGLWRVVETLFGVRIIAASPPRGLWHPQVRYFRVETPERALIGEFYLDLYARADKQGGAWADTARPRMRARGVDGGRLASPIAFLTCNFPAPVGGKPALFSHEDVITLFHEFGHALHLLLTEVDLYGLSGFGHVEWDAVELPSQFMENYCWEWEVLQHMTRHVDTGEPLPRELYERMIAAKNFQAGLAMLRQLEFALFDMELHRATEPLDCSAILRLLERVRDEVAVVRPPEWNRMPWSFSHIFAGGYAAGYYSYKWAEVLSADAYARFEAEGVLSPGVGADFRREVLARGGSRDAIENFVAFRGRTPSTDALLRHNGMTALQ